MVLAPFRSQMHLLGVKLDPFRTLKVQCGTYDIKLDLDLDLEIDLNMDLDQVQVALL